MKTKLIEALKLAFLRFLIGAAGAWCVLGPIVLVNASDTASEALKIILGLLLVPCYALVLVICLRAKWDALKELASETRLAMGFILGGLLLNEITGVFLEFKHRLAFVYALVGFLLTELAKPAKFFTVFSDFLRNHTASTNPPTATSELSEARSPGELPVGDDGLAHQVAELSYRLAESQRALADYERQHSSWVSAQTDNQQLREIIAKLGIQLDESESQVNQATTRYQELDHINATLQSEIAALRQQLGDRDATIATLEGAVQHASIIQSEVENLRRENQRLHEQVSSQQNQLTGSEAQVRQLTRQYLEAGERYQRLEMEISDLHRRLNDYQSKDRELESLRLQLTNVEDRENSYRQRQPLLEARITDLERELTEAKTQAQTLDDTQRRLRDSQHVCQQLADENCRLWQEVARWRESFTASAAARVAPDSNNLTALQTMATRGTELTVGGQSWLPAASHEPTPRGINNSETGSSDQGLRRTAHWRRSSRSSTTRAAQDQKDHAGSVVSTSVRRQWRPAAVAASIAVVAGLTALGIQGDRLSPPQEPPLAIDRAPEETRPHVVAKPQSPAAPPQRRAVEIVRPKPKRGMFQTVLSTQVFSEPSENSALVAAINAGMKVNVVNSRQGWLEIRSKHGRPPGFIRQETAVMVAQN